MKARCLWLVPAVLFVALLSMPELAHAAASDPGAVIAGKLSPWRHAHFVLYAYGAIWGGLVLYLVRLSRLMRGLDDEVRRLRDRILND